MWICLRWLLHISTVIEHLVFGDQLLSHGMMSAKFIHVGAWSPASFFFTAESYFIVWMGTFCLFVHHVMVDEYLRCFHLLAIRNNGAGNICFQVFVWMHLFIPLGVYLGVGLLGLWQLYVYHLEKISYWFPIRCSICIYTFSMFSPTFVIVCLFYFSHPCACKVVTKIYSYVFIYEFCSFSSYT